MAHKGDDRGYGESTAWLRKRMSADLDYFIYSNTTHSQTIDLCTTGEAKLALTP
jgi:hypothetical protein